MNNTEVASLKPESPILRSEPSMETRIQIDAEINFTIVEKPKGAFTDKKVRNEFIKKVYSILLFILLLTITGTAIMLFFFKDKLNISTLLENDDTSGLITVLILLIGSAIISMAIVCTLSCFESVRRKTPLNYILLAILVVSETIFVGIMCCQYHGKIVLFAMLITAVVVLSVTLLAMTPWKFFTERSDSEIENFLREMINN